jgi:CheY-like chemotaxis protein
MADIRVLIVEDDPFIAMDIETAVAEQLGADVELIVVDSVKQAHRVSSSKLSCALLDIDVVGGKTFDVAATLLESGTPFAFVSGSAPGELPEGLRAAPFLRKPFSISEITNFVSGAVAAPVKT